MYTRQRGQSEIGLIGGFVGTYIALAVIWAVMEMGELVVATVNSLIAAIGL